MLFNINKGISYSFQESIFSGKDTYFSESVVSVLEYNGTITPYGCTGVDVDKRTAFKKGFSESLDRRANMIHKFFLNHKINTYSLIDKKIVQLESKYASFREHTPSIDTTATAAHSNINKAYVNALFELFQKNSLFIFWYGSNSGYLIRVNTDDKEFYIVENTFGSILTVINIQFDTKSFSIGLGTSVDLNEAIYSAKKERLLLKDLTQKNYVNNSNSSVFNSNTHIKFLKDKINRVSLKEKFKKNPVKEEEVIENLPRWIKDLRVYIVPQEIGNFVNVNTAKIYSSQLYLSVPSKINLDLNKDINRLTLNLSKSELKDIPEMPML